MDRAIGDLVGVPMPDPIAVAQFGEEQVSQGRIPMILQIVYQVESAALPTFSTKLILHQRL